jgi:hypothetical protein
MISGILLFRLREDEKELQQRKNNKRKKKEKASNWLINPSC